jgi:hypothetical protein
LEILTGRNYLSYSALQSWLDCGERFRLERVLDAPQSKAWWFIGGDAVHKATEDCDIDGITDPDEARTYFRTIWQNSLSQLDEDGVDFTTIKAGGRKTTANPDKENHEWWEVNGPEMVVNWCAWREARFAEGWRWLTDQPSGSIEIPVEIAFDDVQVKGYIDRVMVNPNAEVAVVDLKSGSRQPESSLQLGIYALGMSEQHGITPSLGAYYMTRKGDITQPTSLLHYTRDLVGGWFSSAKRGIEAEVFIPNVTGFCNSCSVAQYCTAVGGNPANI